jgi:hypothetical protein
VNENRSIKAEEIHKNYDKNCTTRIMKKYAMKIEKYGKKCRKFVKIENHPNNKYSVNQ